MIRDLGAAIIKFEEFRFRVAAMRALMRRIIFDKIISCRPPRSEPQVCLTD